VYETLTIRKYPDFIFKYCEVKKICDSVHSEKNLKRKEIEVMRNGIFGFDANTADRFIERHNDMVRKVEHLKGLGARIVLTSGSFDLIHIGHARYLEEAKKHGDFLVVGVDGDDKIKKRKGPDRPIVPENERVEMLTHIRCVDLITIKRAEDEKWRLIKGIRPDILIATQETYTVEQLGALKEFCREVIVLEPQAETTTSAKIRKLQIGLATRFEELAGPALMTALNGVLEKIKGGE
jgi:rfaE bifunctional protein nucleotidyltransferase chain/domain